MPWLAVLLLLVGFALLVVGAEALVRGSVGLARRAHISPLVIGLTFVAIGTSTPELVVSSLASYRGDGELAVANVVGSNLLNTLVVLGATAAILPVMVQRGTVRRDIPLVSVAGLLVWGMAFNGIISRVEGVFLLLAAVAYTVHVYRAERPRDRTRVIIRAAPGVSAPILVLLAIGGLALLVLGGRLVVVNGSAIAAEFGVSDRIIGLTVVALGTSAPELATSIVASLRRQVDLAVGNVVGSNLLNLLLVLGGAALVRPMDVPRGVLVADFPVMIGAGLLLLPLAATGLRLVRKEGLMLLGAYGIYLALLLTGRLTS